MSILKAQVFGRVQGVWFRGTTQKMATQLALTGWVKNELDGSVRVFAEGPEDAIKKLVEWLHQGPSYAKVMKVKYDIQEGIRKYHTFSITN
ncbi:MAG: acylphosphatase [Promethearchaeia archaeon]|nr:MAG: acylphosphatase [Candidatus Lokiarchaeia archaeon]